jgi:hypothetical protein
VLRRGRSDPSEIGGNEPENPGFMRLLGASVYGWLFANAKATTVVIM